MYPSISDLIYDLSGLHIPMGIQTFGFFMMLAFLFAAYSSSIELKRKEKQGLLHPAKKKILNGKPVSNPDIVMNALWGFIAGYKLLYVVLNYTACSNDPQGMIFSPAGNLAGGVAGAIIAAYLKYREQARNKGRNPEWAEEEMHPYQLTGNIAVIAALSGIIGAKLFHNLENLNEFMSDPLGALLSFSGLTFYGGLIMASVAVLYYTRKNNIPSLHMVDAAAPGLMLAYGIGRIGCQLAGDGDWGINNVLPKPSWMSFLPDWVWAFRYPHNVISEGIPVPGCEGKHCMMLEHPVFPTPLYESVACILLFFLLWSLRKKINTPGVLFCVYLMLNGAERFLIEKIRINNVYHLGSMQVTQAEIISSLLLIAGAAGTWYFMAGARRKAQL